MKEIKAYVDELSENCAECKYYTQFDAGMGCMITQELRPMDECGNYMQASCPLHSIKDHDRELVKEVCEKISNHFKTTCYISIDEQNIYDVLDQIQKEFEK